MRSFLSKRTWESVGTSRVALVFVLLSLGLIAIRFWAPEWKESAQAKLAKLDAQLQAAAEKASREARDKYRPRELEKLVKQIEEERQRAAAIFLDVSDEEEELNGELKNVTEAREARQELKNVNVTESQAARRKRLTEARAARLERLAAARAARLKSLKSDRQAAVRKESLEARLRSEPHALKKLIQEQFSAAN